MVASRHGSRGGLRASFGLGVLILLLLPSGVGHQDLAALIAREPPADRAFRGAFASPFGTIHAAKLGLPHPIGAALTGLLRDTKESTRALRARG